MNAYKWNGATTLVRDGGGLRYRACWLPWAHLGLEEGVVVVVVAVGRRRRRDRCIIRRTNKGGNWRKDGAKTRCTTTAKTRS